MASTEYLIALAFYAQPGSSSTPSDATLDTFADQLERRYHALIRAQLGGFRIEPTTLAYVSALAAMSPQRTAQAQVQAACRFFTHVNPRLPDSGPAVFAAIPTSLPMRAGMGDGLGLAPTDGMATRSVGRKRGTGVRKAAGTSRKKSRARSVKSSRRKG